MTNCIRNILIVLGMCVAVHAQAYDFKLYLEETPVTPGETADVTICFDTDCKTLIGFQFDIVLPEGFEIVKEDGDYIFDFDTSRIKRNSHTISSADVKDGVGVRLMGISLKNDLFKGTEGAFIYMQVNVPADFKGDKVVRFSNCRFSMKETTIYEEGPFEMTSVIKSTVPAEEIPEPASPFRTLYLLPEQTAALAVDKAEILANDNDAVSVAGVEVEARNCGIAWLKTVAGEKEIFYMVMVCPSVTVSVPEGSGYVQSHAVYGEPMKVHFDLAAGWTINNLRHNGEDVTELIDNDHSYQVNPLDRDTNLTLALEEVNAPTGVQEINPSGIKVWCENMRLHIDGAQGETITYYNLQGLELGHTTEYLIDMPAPGIYIVKIAKHTFKLEVR